MHNIEATHSVAGQEDEARSSHALEQLEFHDPLTGLPNRSLFFDRMDHELARVRRYESGFALMKLDLDEFAEINKSNGQAVGDLVLRNVAKMLIENVRDIDTVARMDGDEFVILLDGLTNKKEAEKIALKIFRSMSDPIRLDDGKYIKIGASVSIVFSPQDGVQVEHLMSCADQAMSVAKNNGKGLIGFSKYLLGASGLQVQSAPTTQDNGMNLGIAIIDAQHAAMANYIRGIVDSITNGDQSAKLVKRIDLLAELCQIHFQTEEDLMKLHDLPDQEEHHAEHMRRLAGLRSIFKKLNFNGQQLETFTQEINDWLQDHIRSQDAELATQLKSKGVS
jgi:diguanylate cyclase (GGDEF)-like protein/hemerythrin-like metal-binding protein